MEDLSLHILDIVENATNAGAALVEIHIEVDSDNNLFALRIRDDGRGMDQEMLSRVRDPFVTTRKTRRVGLGLSMLEQAAQEAGGYLKITSEPGRSGLRLAMYVHWATSYFAFAATLPGWLRNSVQRTSTVITTPNLNPDFFMLASNHW